MCGNVILFQAATFFYYPKIHQKVFCKQKRGIHIDVKGSMKLDKDSIVTELRKRERIAIKIWGPSLLSAKKNHIM